MKTHLLVTATGEDRPGIVARLTEVLVDHGANLHESRMALLGGEFAAIILVSAESDKIDKLIKDLELLKEEGITIATKQTKTVSPDRFKGFIPYDLSVSGADHEGIVHRVTKFLHESQVNIETMESDVINAPISGTPLFSMRATVQVPPTVTIGDLRQKLNLIGEQESVEIDLRLPV